jgi:hypothetical protein
MLTLRQFAWAMTGVGQLLRFRRDAFVFFEATPAGFWRSFWAAILILPVWILVLVDQAAALNHPSPVSFLLAQMVGYAVSWLAYPLLMVKIGDFLDRWPRYYSYMVAYNWFQVLQAVAWFPLVFLVDAKAPAGLVAIVWLSTHGVLMTYSWFIAKRGLMIDGFAAGAIVAIDLLLSMIIDRIAEMVG